MGVIYRARQLSLNRIVALKMILAGRLASAADVQRFRQEAEAAANLDHPNILPIYEVGEHEGQYFFSMKLVEGSSLAGTSTKQPAASKEQQRRAVGVVATVARAVHFAHQRGILHRDLKPGNILLGEQGQPYVTDFGLAKRVKGDSDLTQSGAILGTPAYMAPEQARAEKGLSTATDVYSLGAILYELLTGRPPFLGATAAETLYAVQHGEPRRLRSLVPALPRDLETICLKSLQKDPSQRYASAEGLADDLDRWLAGEPIQARPVGRPERLWRWCRRNPAVAALMTLALLALVLGTAFSTYFALRAADEAEQAKEQATLAHKESVRAREAEERALHNELTTRQNLYLAQMSQAHRSWQAGQVSRVQELLDAQQLDRAGGHDFRGFEWHYLRRLLHSENHAFRQPGASSYPSCLAFRPCTTQVAWAERGLNGHGAKAFQVQLRDALTGKLVRTFPGWSVIAFSADGKYLATPGADGPEDGETITIYEVETGKQLTTLPGKRTCAFTADGKYLATVVKVPGQAKDAVRIWEWASGKEVITIPGRDETILVLAISPGGKLLAVGGTRREENFLDLVGLQRAKTVGYVRIVEAHTGKQRWIVDREQLGAITGLVFSPDGKRLVTVCNGDASPRVWDVAAGRELFTLIGHTHTVSGIAYDPDGRFLASAGLDQTTRLWDAADGRLVRVYRGHTAPVLSVAFGDGGKLLATASEDGSVKIWNATQDQEGQSFPLPNERVCSLAFGPASNRLAVGASGLGVWDLASKCWASDFARTPGKPGYVRAAYSGAGRLVSFAALHLGNDWQQAIFRVGGQRMVNLIHNNSRSEIAIREADDKEPRVLKIKGSGFLLALHPGGRQLALTGTDSNVELLDLESGKRSLVAKTSGDWMTAALAFSPDGRWLAQAETSFAEPPRTRITVRELASGGTQLTLKELRGKVTALGFRNDGARVMAATAERIFWSDLATPGHLDGFGLDGPVITTAFSPDGKRLATFRGDGRVLLWDMQTGQQILGLVPVGHWVSVLAFSDDGQRLAAGGTRLAEGASSTVTVWDATPLGR
jgi:WD40 repeat protein